MKLTVEGHKNRLPNCDCKPTIIPSLSDTVSQKPKYVQGNEKFSRQLILLHTALGVTACHYPLYIKIMF